MSETTIECARCRRTAPAASGRHLGRKAGGRDPQPDLRRLLGRMAGR